jgi:hypothetical protein
MNPVVCTASDQCHAAGTCDPATGRCSNPPLPNDTPCDDDNACTAPDVCTDGECTGLATASCKVTGGGFIDPVTGDVSGLATLLILRGSDPGEKANFGFVVQSASGNPVTTPPTGNLNYIDHAANVDVKATAFDHLAITGTHAEFTGMATVNKVCCKEFEVAVDDLGEPGSGSVNPDTFSIRFLDGSYMAAGVLIGGNIQIH